MRWTEAGLAVALGFEKLLVIYDHRRRSVISVVYEV